MKKILILFASLLIVTIMLVGCNSANKNSEQTSTEASKGSALKTFNELYSADGLEKAVYYLNENFDSFNEESKKIYMDNLAKEVSERSILYSPLLNLESVEGPAPRTIENVEWLYQGIYNPETNTLYRSEIDEKIEIDVKSIEDDDFFILCKKYYAMDGNIEDMGFDIIVKKEVYDILMDRYADYSDEPNYYFENLRSYTDYFSTSDTKLESKETYPIVLVEDVAKIEMLRNEWKTEVLIPVKIEDKPTETDKSTESDVQEVLDNKFDALSIEARMTRVINDVNQYTWNMDDLQIAKEEFVKSIFYINEDSKKYINETYIYEFPSSYNFEVNIDSTGSQGTIYKYDGDTYAYVYNSIFGENITLDGTIDISPYDPPMLDTTLVSYNKTDINTYDIIGAYGGTGRIMVTVDYSDSGMVIKSIERYEEKGSVGQFKIEEIKELPSGNINWMEITNPAYQNEPDSNLTTYIFSIEGKYDVIGVVTKKTMDSEQEVYDLDLGGENIVLKYKTMFPTDFSQDTLLIRSAGGTDYEMQLNDAVDRELYLYEE